MGVAVRTVLGHHSVPDAVYTPRQVAFLFRVSTVTVRRWYERYFPERLRGTGISTHQVLVLRTALALRRCGETSLPVFRRLDRVLKRRKGRRYLVTDGNCSRWYDRQKHVLRLYLRSAVPLYLVDVGEIEEQIRGGVR